MRTSITEYVNAHTESMAMVTFYKTLKRVIDFKKISKVTHTSASGGLASGRWFSRVKW